MPKKVFVKRKAPTLVRLYNLFLFFCSRLHIIKYQIDHQKHLKNFTEKNSEEKKSNKLSQEALKQFLKNIKENSLNPATQLFINDELNRTFSNRTKIEKILKTNPSIIEASFSDPIFIVGLPRTGTTALQKMFSFLGNCRVLKLWELHYPTAHLEGEYAIKIARNLTRKYAFLQNFSKPEQKYIHPVGVDEPDECFRLLFNSFTSIAISSALGLDDYENWVLESDMLSSYQDYKVQLQILSQSDPKKQLVLKAPEHLWNLDILFKVFPSARVIMTHRDPLSAIASYSSMISMFRRTAYKKTDFKHLGLYVTSVFEKGLKGSYRVRENQSFMNEIIDIHCTDIQKNPEGSLKNICSLLNIKVHDRDCDQLKKWLDMRKPDLPGRHSYSFLKYGVNRDIVKKTFQFYDDKKYLKN